jgi:flavin reductase (DIM6/NTAB) family NADH-FMN oxidoreductase RutF
VNCAPFSYFTVVSHDPPLLVIGICTVGKKKDTLVNIETTGQFVVNIMSTWYLER